MKSSLTLSRVNNPGPQKLLKRSVINTICAVGMAICSFNSLASQVQQQSFRQPMAELPRIEIAPNIDGVLEQGEWQQARKITQFIEYRPEVGEAPDYPIDAYIGYDADYFYVAATIHQPQSTLVDRVLTQGSYIWREDYFGLVLDTNFDKSDAYLFHVTPSGVKVDGMVNGSQWIGEWSTLWYSKTSINQDSWSIEIAIPMQSISFDANANSWGLQLRHKTSKPFQEYFWNLNNTQDYPWHANQLAEITGIKNVTQGKGIEVRPSLSVQNSASGTDSTPSVDLFYKLTPGLTGLVTLNTDFTGTEVDDQDVNMTRFNSYFAERRDFFLQDIQLFQFGGFDSQDTNGMPFYSRRMGLGQNGQPLDINWGTKLTGSIGDTQLGILSVNQQQAGSLEQGFEEDTQLSVARARHLITEHHSLGGIVTQGSPDGKNSRTFGLDYQYNDVILGDQSIRAELWYQDVDSAAGNLNHSESSDTDAYGINIELPNDEFYFFGQYRYIGENFAPALGFVSRNGIKQHDYRGFYRQRPKQGVLSNWLNFYQIFSRFRQVDNVDGELKSREFQFRPIDIQTKQADRVRLTLRERTEVLSQTWNFSDTIQFAEGEHQFSQTQLWMQTGTQRSFWLDFTATVGEYFSADFTDFYVNAHYSPNKHWNFNLGRGVYYYQQGHDKYNVFRSHLKVNLAFNTEWSWNNTLQHNTRSNQFSIFSRLRYQPAPDRLYQVSFNRGYDLKDGWHERFETHDETALKLNAIFRW